MRISGINSYSNKSLKSKKNVGFGKFLDKQAYINARKSTTASNVQLIARTDLVDIYSRGTFIYGNVNKEAVEALPEEYQEIVKPFLYVYDSMVRMESSADIYDLGYNGRRNKMDDLGEVLHNLEDAKEEAREIARRGPNYKPPKPVEPQSYEDPDAGNYALEVLKDPLNFF